MMKLSTMKKVMSRLYSKEGDTFIEKILEPWGFDEDSVAIVRASANFVLTFTRDGNRYFLRFNDSSERDYPSIEAELAIVKYLGDTSLNVVKPVTSSRGNVIEVAERDIGTFYAVVFEAMEGNHHDLEEMTDPQLYLWGKALGNLHEHFKQLPESFKINRPSWKERLVEAKSVLRDREPAAYRECNRLLKWIEELTISNENYGIIHYDFELDNVMFENKTLGILDFDDSTVHWYAADIVYALRDAGDFDVKNPVTRTFIEGYESETDLDSDILKSASCFERMHYLISLARLIRAVDIEEDGDHPGWLEDLRVKLVGVMGKYRAEIEKLS
ncbi:phosphotransferase enzyme family protein [Lysinibacillus sphaericus]